MRASLSVYAGLSCLSGYVTAVEVTDTTSRMSHEVGTADDTHTSHVTHSPASDHKRFPGAQWTLHVACANSCGAWWN